MLSLSYWFEMAKQVWARLSCSDFVGVRLLMLCQCRVATSLGSRWLGRSDLSRRFVGVDVLLQRIMLTLFLGSGGGELGDSSLTSRVLLLEGFSPSGCSSA